MADGGGEEIQRFVVVMDAKTDKILDKLNGLNKSVHSSAQRMQKDLSEVNVEKALGKVFDSSRLAVLDAGQEKIKIFGSALESLGPAGLAAAAAIAAVGGALEQAKKAAEFAEDLERTSKAIGVSTNALQEYDFVATASGIKTDVFRASIQGLNEKIGQLQSGAVSNTSKTGKVFQALLGDDPARRLRELGSVRDILPIIADKLASLPAAERAGLAARIDLGPILPALLKGKVGLEEFVAEAHAYGFVIDADVIEKSAAAAEKLKIMSEVIDKNLKVSFAELSPFLVDAATGLATAARNMANFVREAKDAIEPISKFVGQILNAKYALANFDGGLISGGLNYINGLASGGAPGHGLMQQLASQGRNDKLSAGVNDLLKGGHRHSATIDAEQQDLDGSGKPVSQLVADKARKGPKGPNPEEVAKHGADAIAKALDDELRAREGLTSSAQARLDIELQLLKAETSQKKADLDAEVTLKKIAPAAAAQAKTLLDAAAAERAQLLTRQAGFEIEDKQIDVYKSRVDSQIKVLENEAATAATSGQRQKIEAQILALKQQELLDIEGTRLDREVKTGAISSASRDSQISDLKKSQASDTAKQQYDQTYTAIHGALDAAVKGGWPGLAKYMADKLKTNMVDALANAFTNIVIGGGKGGGGGGGLFGSLLGAVIPHFADGTSSAPGGTALVGERGPELVNLPRGAGVVPNNLLGSLGGVSKGMAVASPSFSFDLRGAVMTDDLVAQMNQIGDQARQRATRDGAQLGVMAARQLIPAEMGRQSSLRLA